MHSVGHTRFTFGLLQLLVAAVCAFCSFGWGACVSVQWTTPMYCDNWNGTNYYVIETYSGSDCNSNRVCSSTAQTPPHVCVDGSLYYTNLFKRGTQCRNNVSTSCGSGSRFEQFFGYSIRCNTQAEADSVACLNGGNLWIDGECWDEQRVCENDGGQWVDGQCVPRCNDHIAMPDKCEEIWKSGYNVDGDGNPGGGGYWAITTYECFYDSCAMSLNCQEKSSFPAGNLSCNDFQDTSGTPGRCVGVMGYNCIMQCGNGSTINCECDGDCQNAINNLACACASSSSTPHSSSSGGGSSSSGETSSSDSGETSSDSGETSSGSAGGSSGSGGDWEYNYTEDIYRIRKNSESMVGYLSDIDRQIAALNFQQQSGDNSAAVVAAVAAGTDAQNATKDTLHSMHGTLDRIDSALNQEVETEDYSGWISSASNMANMLYSMAADTSHTLVSVDSMKADTSNFKSKYSGLFISNVYTREGCYTFTIKDSGLMGRIGRTFKLGASLDFGSIGGFDLCAILRGVVRACGALLCLLITIKAYRSAFSSSDG